MNKLEQLKSELAKINQGCGKNLGAYMEIPKEYENASDKIRKEKSFSVEVICGKQELCPSCQAEISALKKGISACEERDKEILEKIEIWRDNLTKKKMDFYEEDIDELKQQLTNQSQQDKPRVQDKLGCGKHFKVFEHRYATCGNHYYDEDSPTLCDDCKKLKAVKDG